ncbi:hypothetical protein NA57DRAFT_59837 [Rhizodiscina lignyota]|uniref:CENP-V/GFA domain-containing protein n=1 Tax=Rhizodiscina lignyota TaxID=1504668 RepID=A0A9P4I7V7_9PEZI|nr:hypothetical protein NA57DRAFT_59837 [Rhizodiscina lignyota]
MSSNTPVITGSCRCRSVQYYTTTPPRSKACNFCHCQTCRRLSGAPFLPFADFDTASVLFFSAASSKALPNSPKSPFKTGIASTPSTSAASEPAPLQEAVEKVPALKEYRASPHASRFFCGDCGSQLAMWYDAEPGMLGLTLGTMDEESMEKIEGGLKGKGHIWVKEKAGWFDLPDDGSTRLETMGNSDRLLEGK